jgi:uncharacterized membrane protein YphA (DoxX/SURF4 family)
MSIMTAKAKKITLNIITILLIVVFVGAGFAKLMRTEMMVDNFERYDIPIGLMLLLGFLELSAAIGLLIPKVRLYAAAGLSIIMAGAVVVHVYHNEMDQIAGPIVFFALLITFITMRNQLLKATKTKKK